MHIEFFLEEPSAEDFLGRFLPKILAESDDWNFHVFQGKPDLLGKLPDRLKAYRHYLPSDWRIVILIDEDREDCVSLKKQLEDISRKAGLTTKSVAGRSRKFVVLNRIAVEELEAWYFGDVAALTKIFPGVPRTLLAKERFRNPDAIAGGTWEALEQVLQRAGYYKGGLPKKEVARKMAPAMNPGRNLSTSFNQFINGLASLH